MKRSAVTSAVPYVRNITRIQMWKTVGLISKTHPMIQQEVMDSEATTAVITEIAMREAA